MAHLEADAIAALWDDLLQHSPLPPQVAGVTAAEYELARLVQAGPVLIIDTPAAETWVWSNLHLRDAGAFESSGRPFADLGAMEAVILEAWHTSCRPLGHDRLPGRPLPLPRRAWTRVQYPAPPPFPVSRRWATTCKPPRGRRAGKSGHVLSDDADER